MYNLNSLILMKRLCSALFALNAILSVFAAEYVVKAKVTDKSMQPIEFATYRIFAANDTIKPVAFGVTDIDGNFNKNLSVAGDYTAKVTAVGVSEVKADFKVSSQNPIADLGTLVCGDASKLLGEVTVTAQKPLVVREIDRIGYDVQGDIESKTSNLQDMLKKVPFVSVDPDGTIKVKGSSDFKIYKNGRPNNSFTNNAKDIFKAIPASMIKRIEVITEPGAREDAEGTSVILNIITEQGLSIEGIMANVALNYDMGGSDVPAPNLWAAAQIGKLTLSAYGGAAFTSKRKNIYQNNAEGVYEDSGNRSYSQSETTSKSNVNWWGISGSYELDSLNLFTLEFGGYSVRRKNDVTGANSLTDANGNLIYYYGQKQQISPSRYLDFNGNLNYQHSTHRKGEMLTFSYAISTTDQRVNSQTNYFDEVNMPVDYSGYLSDSKFRFMEHTLQADWTKPLGKIHVLDLGVKYIYRDNHSKTWQDYYSTERALFTDFTHRTSIAAGFADYRVKLRKFSLRAGLRYEYSHLSAKYADGLNPDFSSNLSDWVPNAAISYDINDENTLKLSYGSRISRPGISYLNPAVSETPTATSQGNPDLESSRNNSFDLNYGLISNKLTIDMSVGYAFSNNAIIAVQRVENDHTYSGYANAGRNRAFNGSLFAQWTISSKTSLMINANMHYNHYANNSLHIKNSGWSGFAYSRISQKLPWKLTGSVDLTYWNGSVSIYDELKPVGISAIDYTLSLSRNFLKENRLSARVYVANPFYPGNKRYRSESFNTSYKTESITRNKKYFSFGAAVSYRFGSMNAQVKKTATTISNDDLVGRKN